jgi:hypothetical protein
MNVRLRGRVGLSRLALVILVLISVRQPSVTLAQQQRYETPPVLSASQILPRELLTGTNFRVQERVVNDGLTTWSGLIPWRSSLPTLTT